MVSDSLTASILSDFTISIPMFRKMTACFKSCSTFHALVIFFIRMRQHVNLQIGFSLKFLPTLLAFKFSDVDEDYTRIYDSELIFLESLMMNLRTSHTVGGKTWIIHWKTYLWKYDKKLLHKLRWWSLFHRERYIRLLLLWTLEGPIQMPVTCQFWFEYPQFSTIEQCAPLLVYRL